MAAAAGARAGSSLSVAEVLRIDEVQAGLPKVVAGMDRLHLPVRWVHISEVPDVAPLLRGGELLLTTGIALPDDDAGLERYVEDLAAAGVSALCIELVRRYAEVPRVLVEAAERCGLPLVAFQREVAFVAITEAVDCHVLDKRLATLRIEERVHRAFHSLGAGASAGDVVEKMSELAHCPVVFESLSHRPLAVAAHAVPLEELLAGWEARSRWVESSRPGWLTAPVEARSQPCGRVVLLLDEPPDALHFSIIDSGTAMLAVASLIAGQAPSLEHAARRQLVNDIAAGQCRSIDEVHVRARALGVALHPQRLAVMAFRSAHPHCREELVAGALDRCGTTGLVGQVRDDLVFAIVALAPTGSHEERVGAVALDVRSGYTGTPESLAVGAAFLPADVALEQLARTMVQADEAARSALGSGNPGVVTTADIGLRGLLRLLSDDPRVQRFTSGQLRRLWEHDERNGSRLLDTLTIYLESGGNKSTAATRAHSSRAAFYHALDRIAEIGGADLEDPEVRTALHVAILASAAQGPGGAAAPAGVRRRH